MIRTATTYVIEGTLSEEELASIKSFCINPVDSRQSEEEKPETLVTVFEEPADVKIFDGFCDMEEAVLIELYTSLNLAMTFRDCLHIRNYFRNEEKREMCIRDRSLCGLRAAEVRNEGRRTGSLAGTV